MPTETDSVPLEKRNQIKSTYLYNAVRLDYHDSVVIDFNGMDASVLGAFASKPHYELKHMLADTAYYDGEKYILHREDDRQECQALLAQTVRRIRIRNLRTHITRLLVLLILTSIAGGILGVGIGILRAVLAV